MRSAVLLFCTGLALAQTPTTSDKKCHLEGRVLDAQTGAAVARARVTLIARPVSGAGGVATTANTLGGGGSARATTDAEGRFVFPNLEPGEYQVSARRDSFSFNARQAENISLRAGDEERDVLLRVAPLGVISGHVRSEDGDALQKIQVSLLSYAYGENGRQFSTKGSATTNDLGEFRLFGVPAGKYYLRAGPTVSGPRPEENEAFVAAYYPGAMDPANAAQIELTPGQEMRGIEFSLRRSRRVAVSGTVSAPAGAMGVMVGAIQKSDSMTSMTGTSLHDPDGNFVLRGFAPGAYTLTARASLNGKPLNAALPIQVGANDIEGITLRLMEPTSLKGRVIVDDGSAVKPSEVRVTLRGRTARAGLPDISNGVPAGIPNLWDSRGNVATASGATRDGAFTLSELDTDVYRLSVAAPEGVYLKTARCGNSDVLESGLDLTGGAGCELTVAMGLASGQVDGVVQNSDQPVPEAIVTLAQSGTRRTDLFKSTTTDAAGRFQFAAVAPGNYRLHAWDDVDVNAVRYDPDFLKSHENEGRNVQVTEQNRETVTLKLIR